MKPKNPAHKRRDQNVNVRHKGPSTRTENRQETRRNRRKPVTWEE